MIKMTRATSIVPITAMVKKAMSKLMVQRLIYHSVDIDKMKVFKKGNTQVQTDQNSTSIP